jgi:hypothetical protein
MTLQVDRSGLSEKETIRCRRDTQSTRKPGGDRVCRHRCPAAPLARNDFGRLTQVNDVPGNLMSLSEKIKELAPLGAKVLVLKSNAGTQDEAELGSFHVGCRYLDEIGLGALSSPTPGPTADVPLNAEAADGSYFAIILRHYRPARTSPIDLLNFVRASLDQGGYFFCALSIDADRASDWSTRDRLGFFLAIARRCGFSVSDSASLEPNEPSGEYGVVLGMELRCSALGALSPTGGRSSRLRDAISGLVQFRCQPGAVALEVRSRSWSHDRGEKGRAIGRSLREYDPIGFLLRRAGRSCPDLRRHGRSSRARCDDQERRNVHDNRDLSGSLSWIGRLYHRIRFSQSAPYAARRKTRALWRGRTDGRSAVANIRRSPQVRTRVSSLERDHPKHGDEVDGLWGLMRRDLREAVVVERDWSYLRYRYFSHPTVHYEVLCVRSRLSGTALGVMVLRRERTLASWSISLLRLSGSRGSSIRLGVWPGAGASRPYTVGQPSITRNVSSAAWGL